MKEARQKRIKRLSKVRKKKIIRFIIIMIPIAICLDIFYHYTNNLGATLLIGGLVTFVIGVSQLGGKINKNDIDGSRFDSGYG